jgi:hypothetical protein
MESLNSDPIDRPFNGREIASGVIYASILIWINVYICRELFFVQAAPMNSMHGFWAALAKHGGDSWFRSTWWPFWDCGIPSGFTYAPLIPALISAWSAMWGITHDLAFQFITGVVYCLVPVSLFLMAWLMTRTAGYSFLAAVFYSLTSSTQLIVPDESFSFGHFWDARRLLHVASWDETPHLTALALLPIVILLITLAIRKRRPAYYAILVFLIVVVTLATDFAPVEVMMAAVCLIAVFPKRDFGRNAITVSCIGVLAYVIVSPFLSPSLIHAIREASAVSEGGWSIGSITGLAIVALGWIVLWLGLERWTSNWRLRFFALFAYLTSCIPVVAVYFHRQLAPQPGRYKFEMELAIALVAIFGLRPLFEKASIALRAALLFLFLALAAEQIVSHRQYAKIILRGADLTQTVEYRAADWVARNLPGVRVMFPGSIAMWANDFTAVPQFGGSSWSQAYSQVQQLGLRSIYNGSQTPEEDARISFDWLQAFGVRAIAVSGPKSQEYWKPFSHPAKFDGLLPVLWSDADVTVYQVPQRTPSLAHVVTEASLVSRAPRAPGDTDEIEKYVAALNDPLAPAADFQWVGTNHIQIRTTADRRNALSIQVSYHPGWHAKVNIRKVEVRRDGLGLMWVRPECSGLCEVQLDYDGGWELRLCRYLSFTVITVLFLAILWRLGRRFRAAPK